MKTSLPKNNRDNISLRENDHLICEFDILRKTVS